MRSAMSDMHPDPEDSAPDTSKALDPIAIAILDALRALPQGGTLAPEMVARSLQEARARKNDKPDAWRRFLLPVRQQAIHLARQGRIDILRKGEIADPNDFKGLWRMRLKADA